MSFLHQTGSGCTALPGEHMCIDNAIGQTDAGEAPISSETTDGRERVDPHHVGTTPGGAVV
jgi:hypothetical protein